VGPTKEVKERFVGVEADDSESSDDEEEEEGAERQDGGWESMDED